MRSLPSIINEKKKLWKNLSIKSKCSNVWNNITVEPMLAFYIMPSVLASLATQNLNLEKACRVNLGYSSEVCDSLTRRETANYTMEETNIQTLVAGMAVWKSMLQSALPCMLILFWGSWSDRHHRRKPCMLIPIVGEFLTALGLIGCTYFEWTPMEVAGITESIFPGLTGGWFTMMMGIFSYIADVTTEEQRTLRIGIVNLCFSLGVPIGMAFSGVLLKLIGFYGVFSVSASMYLMAFLYGLFFVKEPVKMMEEREEKPKIESKPIEKKNLLADFFDKDHIVETFRVAFKNGDKQRRIRVMMLIIVVMVVIGPMHGEMTVIYLFTRFQFNWSEVEFSFFSTYGMLTGLIGVIFSVGVFSHLLKIDDALIGVMSSVSKILSSFIYAFAVTEWQLYLGPIAEILNGTQFIAMRSIASKLVSSHELGKINSLFGVAEALMPFVYSPMYASLYAATIHTLPGAFFLLGGFLTIPAVIIFLWMYKQNKNDEALAKKLEEIESKVEGVDKIGISTIDGKMCEAEGDMETGRSKRNGSIVSMDGMGRMGSVRRVSLRKNSTMDDDGRKNSDSIGVIQETIEIVRDLPALNLEHCKL